MQSAIAGKQPHNIAVHAFAVLSARPRVIAISRIAGAVAIQLHLTKLDARGEHYGHTSVIICNSMQGMD